ncbi:hypothetical protein, partial [Klebsiella pneumoniae]|uniref:hypothetical protein n=1 Tax=Klebsiella pneumoniae TaxID=573 RepID=UPI003B597172
YLPSSDPFLPECFSLLQHNYPEAEKQASFLGGTQAFLAEKLGQSTQALKAFNSESLKINWGGKEGEKLIKQAERRLALSKLEGEAKARQ